MLWEQPAFFFYYFFYLPYLGAKYQVWYMHNTALINTFVLICNYFVLFKCKRWLGSMFRMLTYNLTCAWVDDQAELLVHPCRAEVWCTCLIINVVYYLVHHFTLSHNGDYRRFYNVLVKCSAKCEQNVVYTDHRVQGV